MEKVGNFLREVFYLAMLTEPHILREGLLPPQRAPTAVVSPTTTQMVGDLTPPLRTGPDIAADAEAAAQVLFPGLLAKVRPPPVRSQVDLHHETRFTGLMLPVVVLEALVFVVDARCTDSYYILLTITTCY